MSYTNKTNGEQDDFMKAYRCPRVDNAAHSLGSAWSPEEPSRNLKRDFEHHASQRKHWPMSSLAIHTQKATMVSNYSAATVPPYTVNYCIFGDVNKQPLTFFQNLKPWLHAQWQEEWECRMGEPRVWKKAWREGIWLLRSLKKHLHNFHGKNIRRWNSTIKIYL